MGIGITNVVAHATVAASDLTDDDFRKGGRSLRTKIKRYRPKTVAVLGVGAYRTAFAQPKATVGCQDACIGESRVWVLPNPSGLNANYQLPDIVRLFRELRLAAFSDHRRTGEKL
jgi:TDG/mug DNA glycosylase family protein